MPAKTSNLYARIEPEVKRQAEAILAQLGMTASNAISIFYKQIILQKGLPFEVKLPKVVEIGALSKEELDAEIEKGLKDMLEGSTEPADKAFADLRKELGI